MSDLVERLNAMADYKPRPNTFSEAAEELSTLRAERDALVKRVDALKEALRAVQTDVATQCPVVMWRGEGGAETTFDYITDSLGEDYTYDDWNEGAHRAAIASDGEDG